MLTKISLIPEQFQILPLELYSNEHFTITSSRFNSGIEALTIKNSRGFITVLPYYGQMVWDAEFDGLTLKMDNMFNQPQYGTDITDTYGCFAFHSGLLSNGCPSSDDDHIMHGEMACAKLSKAWIEVQDSSLSICGEVEFIKGFGAHYVARPSVTLTANCATFDIKMQVTNLSGFEMPLQYMCHMNYAYIDNATLEQNIPDNAFMLRKTIPSHVHPTEQWLDYTKNLTNLTVLNEPHYYDPEIVFLVDDLSQYTDTAEFYMTLPNGKRFVTRFSTKQFNHGTRWILNNKDQKVAAFILPATCRPEGFLAAKNNGTLIMLKSGETKSFLVTTGIDK